MRDRLQKHRLDILGDPVSFFESIIDHFLIRNCYNAYKKISSIF